MTSSRVLRGAIGSIGVVVLVFGLRGVWVHRIDTRPFLGSKDLVAFWLGGALLHDLMVAPVAIVIAIAVRKLVRQPLRSWVLAALVVSAGVTVVAWPALRGYGRRPDNKTVLPRDYVAGWGWILLGIWTVALTGAVITFAMNRSGIASRSEKG